MAGTATIKLDADIVRQVLHLPSSGVDITYASWDEQHQEIELQLTGEDVPDVGGALIDFRITRVGNRMDGDVFTWNFDPREIEAQ